MASTSAPAALRQLPAGEAVANPAFDVTPNWLVKAIITERGTCAASREGLLALYPEEAVADLRDELIATARAMQPAGLNKGTSGNVSVRQGDGFYITPTGMPYEAGADDIPLMALDGSHVGAASRRRNGASTATSTPPARKSAPCCTPIPPSPSAWPACAARFRLSLHDRPLRRRHHPLRRLRHLRLTGAVDAALLAMADRKACLLANHGLLVAGRDLADALALAIELEELCEQYWRACQLGAPVLLSATKWPRCWSNSPATGSNEPDTRHFPLGAPAPVRHRQCRGRTRHPPRHCGSRSPPCWSRSSPAGGSTRWPCWPTAGT
jgi:L-fuculose-phosphate aldolase